MLPKQVEVDETTVADIKKLMCEKVSIPVAAQRLMYRGKVLKDNDQVKSLGFFDGCTVLLLKLPAPVPSTPASTESATVTGTHAANSAPSVNLPVVALQDNIMPSKEPVQPRGNDCDNYFAAAVRQLASIGGPLTDDMARQVNIQGEVLRRMSCDPTLQPGFESMIRSYLSDPELVFSLLPQLKAVCDQHPNFRSFMTNPDVPRIIMRTFSNPSLSREMLAAEESVLQQNGCARALGEAAITNAHQVPDPIMEAIERAHPREEDGDAAVGADTAAGAGAGATASDSNPLVTMLANMKRNDDAEAPLLDSGHLTRALLLLPEYNLSPRALMAALTNSPVSAIVAEAITRLRTPVVTDEERTNLNNGTIMQVTEMCVETPAMLRSLMPKDNPQLNFFRSDDERMRMLSEMTRVRRDVLNAMSRDATTVADETKTKNDGSTGNSGNDPLTLLSADAAPAPADIGAGARTSANAGDADGNACADSTIALFRTIQRNASKMDAANTSPLAAFSETAVANIVGTRRTGPSPPPTAAEQRANAATMYASQLDMLADMGFVDRESNLTALIETGGNVEAATDCLLGGGGQW